MVGSDRRGFTLVEVLVVVILIALGAALAPPTLRPGDSARGASPADSVAALLSTTRALAIERAVQATLVLDRSTDSWWRLVAGDVVESGRWPTALVGARPHQRISVTYSPAGDAWPPLRLRVLQDSDTTTVAVDAWTGRVHVE